MAKRTDIQKILIIGAGPIIGGIMEHIEAAGIHSGDSACVLPPLTISPSLIDEITAATKALASELEVVGLMNVQYAIKDGRLFVLEVNPRASRTVPFVSKATPDTPLASIAARVMIGRSLKDLGLTREIIPAHVSVKEAVLPFNRFPGLSKSTRHSRLPGRGGALRERGPARGCSKPVCRTAPPGCGQAGSHPGRAGSQNRTRPCYHGSA